MTESLLLNFHFLRPWWLLLLIVPILFYSWVFKNDHNLSSWEKVCDKKLLQFLLVKGQSGARKLSVIMMYLGLISAIVIAAGPSWKKQEIPALESNTPLMIVLNLSSEMKNTDVTPNRLARAKINLTEILRDIKGVESGLMVYTDEPFLISPLSADNKLIINLLPAVGFDIMPLNGDRLDRAIKLAKEKIKAAGYKNGNILILSADVGKNFNLALAEAKAARAENIYVNAVHVAQSGGERLKEVAEAGGGIFAVEQNFNAGVFAKKLSETKTDWKESQNLTESWQDCGYYLLFIPLLCCLYFFRRGILAVVLIMGLSSPSFAEFLYSADQEGMQQFNKGAYQQAAQKFEDGNWQAASWYKAGDYQKAVKEYSQMSKSEDNLYNLGNALAKSGKIKEAMEKYEEVLKINPQNEDAKFNLEYLKQQQNQQQQQQNQNNQSQANDNKEQQSQNQNQQQNQENKDNSQQNSEENNKEEQNQNEQNQNAKSSSDSKEEDKEQPQEDSQNSSENNEQKQQQSLEEQKAQTAPAKEGDKDDKYDEEVQARKQLFREIGEDKGGLLRAFIYKEYQKNRYGG